MIDAINEEDSKTGRDHTVVKVRMGENMLECGDNTEPPDSFQSVGCVSGGRLSQPLTTGSEALSLAPPVHMSKCLQVAPSGSGQQRPWEQCKRVSEKQTVKKYKINT